MYIYVSVGAQLLNTITPQSCCSMHSTFYVSKESSFISPKLVIGMAHLLIAFPESFEDYAVVVGNPVLRRLGAAVR